MSEGSPLDTHVSASREAFRRVRAIAEGADDPTVVMLNMNRYTEAAGYPDGEAYTSYMAALDAAVEAPSPSLSAPEHGSLGFERPDEYYSTRCGTIQQMVSSVEGHHAQILKGVLDMCVLASIVEEPNYGYALVQSLNERGLAVQNEGSIYLVLKRLKAAGRIVDRLVPSESGPARKVYEATEAGRDVLAAWMADWEAVQEGVDAVLADH